MKNYDLNNLLDNISLVKCISFFLLIYLVLTLFSLVLGITFDSLLFKSLLYSIMLIFFIFALKKPFKEIKQSYFDLQNSNMPIKVLFIVIANCLFTATIFFVLAYFSNVFNLNFDLSLFGIISLNDYYGIIMYLISIVILSPIVEELLFRGVILRKLNVNFEFSIKRAVIISSILFGLCHNFGGILSAILFGICMSFLYIKSKNILIPIFAHCLNNLFSFILACSGIELFIISNNFIIVIIVILAILTNFILFKDIIKEFSKLD